MTITHSLRRSLAIAALAALLPLGACSKNSDEGDNGTAASSRPSGDTLAEAMSKQKTLSTVSGALRDTGLAETFDSAGSYTIFAPTDEAFAKLGHEADGSSGEVVRQRIVAEQAAFAGAAKAAGLGPK